MATDALNSTLSTAGAGEVLNGLAAARETTLALVAPLDAEQLERVHSPIMSPLAWDLGHIAAYEDLWIGHRLGGLELLRGDLAALYDAFETPRAVRGDIEVLDPDAARAYLAEVRERTVQTLTERQLDEQRAPTIFELVIRHELQHCETMRQTLALAGLLAPADAAARDRPLEARASAAEHGDARATVEPPSASSPAAAQWVAVPGGAFELGAPSDGFAYDNERPRHTASTPAFEIARLPATNEAWLRFAADGGYERRELWSDQGWAWLAEQQTRATPSIASGDPRAPACHVSWFEADAFARYSDARLPSESEWEKAAATAALDGLARVWEWTQSEFDGYPGFAAYPYREYSEVFFGGGYRVLRGGSWATDKRVASVHFRNWDLPQRRQIFAGVRLTRDAR
ncbi:MAG TPA: SUMF1/EgtB/PvdO family nonheme iron enzyme [Solirubrobacteraceae bacterium]|jgi:iron(II)-dependent oxidoreductase|nr:SUMF1/EgtB/PvdO family nonheme iron enzyme [Solirubrobacteraceae bacterium]